MNYANKIECYIKLICVIRLIRCWNKKTTTSCTTRRGLKIRIILVSLVVKSLDILD